jgi:hypothetical protein
MRSIDEEPRLHIYFFFCLYSPTSLSLARLVTHLTAIKLSGSGLTLASRLQRSDHDKSSGRSLGFQALEP